MQLIFPSAKIEFDYGIQILSMYLSLILWTYYLKRKNQIIFCIENNNKKYLIIALLGGVGGSCFLLFTYYISWFNTSIPNGFTTVSFEKFYNSIPMLLSTSIIMPIIEELLFRGTIQELFIRYVGVKKGIVICAFLFAVCHGKGFLFSMIFALFAGYIYFKTKSIIYPIIAHIGNNFTNVILFQLDLIGQDKNMLLIICIGFILISFAIIGILQDKKS